MKTIISFFLFIGSVALAQKPTPQQIMDHVDRLYRSQGSYSEVAMIVKKPSYERTLKLKVWTEDMVNTFIEMTYPLKEKGTKTLKKGNQVWNYLPKADQVVSIPPSMMLSNWMGSDLTNDDLVKQTTLVKGYDGQFIKCDSSNPNEICIELLPKKKTVSVWGKIVLVVQKDDSFPIRQEFFNESQKKVRTFVYSNRTTIQGRNIPIIMKVVMHDTPGNETTLRYDLINFNAKIEPHQFSESVLRRK